MGFLFGAMALLGTVMRAVGTYNSYQQQKSQAEYQRAMNEYNARIAEQQQRREAREGAERQLEERRRGDALVSKQRSLLAKGGVELTSGSPLLLVAETEAQTEMNARKAAYESKLKQQTYAQSRDMSLLNAQAAKSKAKAAGTASYMGAGASLLSGASSLLRNTPGSSKSKSSKGKN